MPIKRARSVSFGMGSARQFLAAVFCGVPPCEVAAHSRWPGRSA
jgi:hypothetical protein